AKSTFKVTANFDLGNGKLLKADLNKKFNTEEEARAFLEQCKGADFSIADLVTKPAKKSPAPPFTTSTLQQEASRKLSMSVSQTMTLAQRLYEAGKISYMRTDSLNLSEEAIAGATSAIKSSYGDDFSQVRHFKTKNSGAQEAHEAIRPTDFSQSKVSGDRNEQRLYELIWKRAIASQMSDAQLEKTTATIGVSTVPETFVARGEVIKFEGFLKVYIESKDEDDEEDEDKGMLPPLEVGQTLVLEKMTGKQGFSRPPARYTEASLVKKLEELGIGRPSTYAPTISTVQKRNYVEKESRPGKEREYRELYLEKDVLTDATLTEITGTENMKLFPTNLAMVVNDFLVEHFANIVDYSFTASVEKEFDEIAHGGMDWGKMIDRFYHTDFHPKVEVTENISRDEVGSSREIGVDPKTGKTVIARLGRYGPLVQLGEAEGDEKPQYASLRTGQFIENITLEDALELFKLPRTVGSFEEKDMVAAIGRFGPYIRHDGKFVSLKKEDDPLTVTEERAIELILAKRKADAEKHIKSFDENPDVQILNGRWGPYIKVGKKNVKIPKDKEPKDLTLAECLELAEKAPEKKRGGRTAAKKKKE
ncbi:MAG: DNA topoisomerase, partial [Bacteroidota bacterium]